MKSIASFEKNHNKLKVGIYKCSSNFSQIRIWDCRFKVPNSGNYPTAACLHSAEHILAVYLKNYSSIAGSVISLNVGMCRTMFYLETTSSVTKDQVIKAFKQASIFASNLTEVPGSKKKECGNYKSHNLEEAKLLLIKFAESLNEKNND